MQLNELFDKPSAKWKVTRNTPLAWTASAKLKNRRSLFVNANMVENDYWDIDFTVDDEHDKTHDGNEFEVMALVAGMLRNFVKDKNPTDVIMHASEENRSKLYERILRRELKGWHIKRFYDEDTYLFAIVARRDEEVVPGPTHRDPDDRYSDGDEGHAVMDGY